jgi:hypothetical protein
MMVGADDKNVLNNFWRVAQEKINNFAQNRRPALINNPGLVAFLLSDRNRQAADFNLLEVKEDLMSMNMDGKKGYVAVVKWMPPLQMQDVRGGDGTKCPSSGIRQTYKKHSFKVDRTFTSKPIEIDMGLIRCIEEGKGEYEADSMYNFLRAVVSQWAVDVQVEVETISNGYIGQFPNRFKGAESTDPCKILNLFRDTTNAYNQVNWAGEKHMKDDIRAAGIDDYVLIGGTRLTDYGELKRIAVANDSGAFDPSMLEEITNGRIIFDDYIEEISECADPMMVVRPGALQVVTYSKNVGDFTYSDDRHRRGTLVDPFFGLTWDVYTNTEVCGDEIKTYMFAELNWGVFGYPDCLYTDDPKRKGNNGENLTDVFLYSIACGDTPICSTPVELMDAVSDAKPFDNDCDEDESCESTCKVQLLPALLGNGDFQITAIVTPTAGATISTWAWEVGGAPVATPTPEYLLVLAQGAYANGETVELTVTDSDGCVANATLIVEVPEIEVEADTNPVACGGLYDYGNVVQATGQTANVVIDNSGGGTISITSITPSGDVVTPVILPTLPSNGQVSFDVEFDNGSTGLKTITIVVTSNDPATPSCSFDLTVTFT